MPCTRLYLIYRPLLSSLRIFARRCFVVVTAFWRPLLPGTAQEVKVNDSQNSGMVGRRVKGGWGGVGWVGSARIPFPRINLSNPLWDCNIFLGSPAPTMSVNWQSIFCPPPILFWRRLILPLPLKTMWSLQNLPPTRIMTDPLSLSVQFRGDIVRRNYMLVPP